MRRTLGDSLRAKLRTLPDMPIQILGFEGFPAHHLRTNAFMAKRATFDRVRISRIETKMDAYRLENGRHSLTRQVQAMGLGTLVVASDGATYDHEQWPLSRTLWQGDQENLLIADNQTRSYSVGGLDRRRRSRVAWDRKPIRRLRMELYAAGTDTQPMIGLVYSRERRLAPRRYETT